jgi:hypothetical protein
MNIKVASGLELLNDRQRRAFERLWLEVFHHCFGDHLEAFVSEAVSLLLHHRDDEVVSVLHVVLQL